MIRMIYAETHPFMRRNVKALLAKASDINLLAETDDGHHAVTLAERFAPDILVTDLMMPSLNGIRVTQRLRTLGLATKVIVLSMDTNEALVRQALKNGARGYVSKLNLSRELLPALRAVHRGELYLDPEIFQIQPATETKL